MPKNNSAARRAERRKDAERRFASSKHSKTGRKANLIVQELDDAVYTYDYDGTPVRRPQAQITNLRHDDFDIYHRQDLQIKDRLDALYVATESIARPFNN